MIGKTVQLRAMEPADIDLLYQWENDRKIWPISNSVTPISRFVLEQYVLNSHQDIFTVKQIRMMIDLVDQQKAIGTIDLFDFDPGNGRIGLGIFIIEEVRGKGYAKEALELIIGYCFDTLMVHQIFCNINTKNEISLKLFREKGFEIIGNKKEWLLINNEWNDEYLLQLIGAKTK